MKYPNDGVILTRRSKLELINPCKLRLRILRPQVSSLRSPNFCYSEELAKRYNKLALF